MKTLQEQLAELKEARATKAARLAEISEVIKQKSATAEDGAEFDAIVDEISQLDNDIRLKQAECINAGTAREPKPVVKTGPTIIMKKHDADDKFEGQSFVRQVIAKAVAHLDGISPVAIAQKRWGKTHPMLCSVIKTAVEGGGSGTGDWGAELVAADTRYTGDFIEYLHGRTVYDRLPLREVPANVQIKGQDGAATGYWVGENNSITISAQSFSAVNLTPLKVAAMAVVSNELLRDSTPAAEALVRDALVEASSKRIDDTFLSTSAASAAVSPEGILQNISADSASGTDADALRADIKTLYADFIAAKTASGLYFVMNPALAKSIQMLYNALGMPEFPGITQDGGNLLGDPVVTGDNVNSAHLILLNPREIYKIGDMGVQVSISREATIEMSDGPAGESQGATAMASNIVNMFQTESTAIKIVRPINFQRRRTDSYCVGYVEDAAYDNSSST
jgi:HK97 family phage major capsid protein